MHETEAIAELRQRIESVEERMSAVENAATPVMESLEKLEEAQTESRDPLTQIMIGCFAIVAKDPFNSGSWDKARKILGTAQHLLKKPDEPKPESTTQ